TSGGIYRLYGLYTPRNTSIMTCFGGTVTDVTAFTADEKAALIRSHPGALLLCPGHVMVSLGTSEPGMYVPAAHNVVGFNLKPDGTERQDVYRVAVTDLASIYNGSGAQFLSLVTAVIYYEP
ncbi:MAG: hypothetical protein J6U26_00490, partial [Lachnospiraceae bacterium]|nr:hypothetical protein [Lachnospiraceae bacterium]